MNESQIANRTDHELLRLLTSHCSLLVQLRFRDVHRSSPAIVSLLSPDSWLSSPASHLPSLCASSSSPSRHHSGSRLRRRQRPQRARPLETARLASVLTLDLLGSQPGLLDRSPNAHELAPSFLPPFLPSTPNTPSGRPCRSSNFTKQRQVTQIGQPSLYGAGVHLKEASGGERWSQYSAGV